MPTYDEHNMNVGRTFPWHEVYTANLDATVDFYTKALGFGTEKMNMGQGDYTMLTMNGMGVAGVMDTNTLEHPNVPPHWAAYLSVDDVDARLAKCKEMGATVLVEPMDIPKVGRMALIQDPQGSVLWLFKGSEEM